MNEETIADIAALKTEMVNMKEAFRDHLELHKGLNVNKQAWAMIVLTGLNLLVMVWGIKVTSDNSRPQSRIGIERTFQGEVKP
jgi:hypothetical protein